ncbi:bifunctional diaminohydroxyphosphoribosylaminopyrimidine deaminase/5-amino-6-(5-phosphoribosylamino)uracil reductase RibD [Aquimarina sp. BL5]|uniref:bifunctional diaminohydroxyphosphoribosylaminopyrimidine deaminase/5-amino-6-(5-phosphoribosylamino)uracil reductase RibD n=1 Tax=Aquimarina sp. BL5 TaxID=1714860 RepID=UPI000E5005B7|nr:bifunctional diaminohydroxyphosphoribosylaminopyrimidine deaminase/5-amino-6-(5-phosphoribosylamino)uracil reductase RibD [Aquimarina sp. BL5]AXT50129.1 bifunctional diaminohydroxyphosphoribosylaminopyrimidine deaminase/5-amino-6-(5-phosphoribosylamino)uracil reductase RibD [Aquimarina sp. BL5]RKN03345.1 bifunctional diaminohydroxyphosphoribosylaminopyrimidine deaminase/5-amino-6-(5-phosphoribosylamino)uracil reductase RibD [Aquimarina sp. BL5]
MSIHETYIRRCLQIATNALGSARPNPMVGSVIVHNQSIIGEGYTSAYGGHHAEVNAVNSVKDKSILKEATIYVTLEPCSHFGKTPPCSDLIIKHKIPNVVIGTIDTHSKVAGKGIEKLKNAGCNVIVGVLENECQKHHKRFFTFHNKKRPYIILKWAQTSDNFIAPEKTTERAPVWITNTYSRQLVHKWRAEEHAILVGNKTVIEDNPKLTLRDWSGTNPIRILIDFSNKTPEDSAIVDNSVKTIVITSDNHKKQSNDNTIYKAIASRDNTVQEICDILFKHEIQSIIIEGGSYTIQSFIDTNLWDEARVFTGKNTFAKGIEAPAIKGTIISEEKIMDDTLRIYQND